jgi:PKD repeat protein
MRIASAGVAAVMVGLLQGLAFAQCADATFTIPANACREERIIPDHTLTGGEFHWDFCTGDLGLDPTLGGSSSLSQALGRPSIEIVRDGDSWFGFVTGTWTNTLYRIWYSNGPRNAPTLIEDLGSLGSVLNGPGSIRILKEGSDWFGLIHNTATGELIRLSFGTTLLNTPTAVSLVSGVGYANSGLACGRDAIDGWIVLLSSANSLSIIRLGTALLAPQPSDILTTPTFPNANNLGDLDLIENCGQWYGMAVNFGTSDWYHLAFAGGLFQLPTVTPLAALPPGNPARIRVAYDAGTYWAFITTLGGNLLRADLGTNAGSVTPTLQDLGNFSGTLQNSFGLACEKNESEWSLWAANLSNGTVTRLDFPNTCDAVPETSSASIPQASFSGQGLKHIDLCRIVTGVAYQGSQDVTILPSLAPDVDFNWLGSCADNPTDFSVESSSPDLQSYQWDFGDGGSSTLPNPMHTYTSPGSYEAGLEVLAANGCLNRTHKSIPVYVAPTVDFSWTIPPTACTNQPYPFLNSSGFDPLSNPSWEWNLNGESVSTEASPQITFAVSGDQVIELEASIPGCSSSVQKTVTSVVAGPMVDFTSDGHCAGTDTQFTDVTVGSVTSYSWTFGDGEIASGANPVHTFVSPGTYSVTLSTMSAGGCENFSTKPLPIYSTPAPDFQIALPPFSCSGAPSRFTDLTPAPTDSNLSSWSWNFGDPATALDVSALRNPEYTYPFSGNYDVSLAVTTNVGCAASVVKSVLISPAPSATFTHSPVCPGQVTQFEGPSGGIASWSWSIGNASYAVQKPQHLFAASGPATVRLVTTGTNGCQSLSDESVTVPQAPDMDFEVIYPCTGQVTEYRDISTSPGDPVAAWSWQFGSTGPVSGNPVLYTYAVPGIVPVGLTITTESGCEYLFSEVIEIVPGPVAYFSALPTEGSAPLPVEFVAADDGVTSWSWDFGDGTPVQTGSGQTHTYFSLGEYVATLTVANALQCSDETYTTIRVIVPAPDARIANFYTLASGDGFTTPVVVIENPGNTTLSSIPVQLVINGSTLIQERVTQSLPPGQSLSYTFGATLDVLSTGQYLCAEAVVDGDVSSLDNRACLQEGGEIRLLTPSPSPATDEVIFDWISTGAPATLTIASATGMELKRIEVGATPPGLVRLPFDVSGLASGIYIAHLRSGAQKSTARFMVSH